MCLLLLKCLLCIYVKWYPCLEKLSLNDQEEENAAPTVHSIFHPYSQNNHRTQYNNNIRNEVDICQIFFFQFKTG